jgi:hypothetical protein
MIPSEAKNAHLHVNSAHQPCFSPLADFCPDVLSNILLLLSNAGNECHENRDVLDRAPRPGLQPSRLPLVETYEAVSRKKVRKKQAFYCISYLKGSVFFGTKFALVKHHRPPEAAREPESRMRASGCASILTRRVYTSGEKS